MLMISRSKELIRNQFYDAETKFEIEHFTPDYIALLARSLGHSNEVCIYVNKEGKRTIEDPEGPFANHFDPLYDVIEENNGNIGTVYGMNVYHIDYWFPIRLYALGNFIVRLDSEMEEEL